MSDRVTVTRHPDGVSLAPGDGHYENLLRDVFGLLAERGDLWDDLVDLIAGETTEQDRHQPAKHAPEDVLAEQIIAALPSRSVAIRLYKPETAVLADSLGAVVQAQARRPLAVLPEQGRRSA